MSDKIVLNIEIDSNNFNLEMSKIFQDLTKEEAFNLASQCLMAFFDKIEPVKFYDYEKKIIALLKDSNGYRYSSENDIRHSSGFKKQMEEFSTTKEGMLNIIKQEILDHAKGIIDSYVKNDTDIKAMIDSVLENLDNNIVRLVNEAVARHIAETIGYRLNGFKDYVLNNINDFNQKLGNSNGGFNG